MIIKADNITKHYGDKQILKGISISLNQEDINVLIGASGSGKSSLCRNLALLDLPTSGKLTIDGSNYNFPSKKVKNYPYPKINFVFQQLFLWPHLTNEENIKLPLEEFSREEKEKLEFFRDFFDIGAILKNYPNESSVGQRQRIAIVRALMLNPKFLFFDEITSSLDIVQTKKIVKLLGLLKKQNIGVMMITHNLQLAKKIADKIFFLHEGNLAEYGSPNILDNPNTKQLNNFLNGVE